ncbi:MAG: LEA type 2 family protein [Thermodesulfobacteriota bacterium]
MRKKLMYIGLCVFLVSAGLMGCAGMMTKPSETNFKTPAVTLDSMEVAHAFGYWYYAKAVAPTKGTPDDVGAPLDLAFTFNLENPNDFAIKLENLKFTVAFENFDLNTVSTDAVQWIPAGKTNQVRVHAHFDVRQSLLSLLVTGGFQLKEQDTNAWAALEKWWNGIPNYEVKVHVKEGSAIFKADGITKVSSFKATFP